MNWLKQSWGWLKWVLAVGVLYWLYHGHREAVAQIAQAPKAWGYLGLAIGVMLVCNLLTFVRWWILVRAQQFEFPLRQAIRLGFVGLISNFVAPGAVGGDIVKAILMARGQPQRRTTAVATVVLDRILGMLGLFLVGAITTLVPSEALDHPDLKSVGWFMLAGSLVGLVSLGLMLWPRVTQSKWVQWIRRVPKVGGLAGELIEGVALFQSRPHAVWQAVLLSLVAHSGLITGFWLCARWMKQAWTPDLMTHFFFLPTAELFGAFVPVPAGMGALEGAVQWFYERVRPEMVSEADAGAAGFLAALAFRLVNLGIAALGGGYYLTSRSDLAQAIEQTTIQSPPKSLPQVGN
ncbi:MAG: lysylphosphatidylglycerol synthase transmembrane domain-containing protein [Planctomycetaceae bacterium]|jgi:uncharacterized membrane protein YbhN (UPF0104 family)